MSKQSDLVSVSQGASGDPLYIDTTNDRVGIGTSSPSAQLEIVGGGTPLRFTGAGASSTGGLGFYNSASQAAEIDVSGGSGQITISSDPTDTLANSFTAFDVDGSERMRIDSSGNLIGGNSTGTSWKIQWSSYGDVCLDLRRYADTGNVILFRDDLTVAGSISVSGSSTSYNTSSDYRLKENVVPLENASDRLAQIPVHRFNFIADPDTTVDGFLAHEVQAFVPEAITGEHDGVDADGNPEYQGIDQSKLVPLLTAALQEALQKIDALEARVATLEGGAA